MSQDQWSRWPDIVEIFVAVRIPNARTLAADEEWRIPAHSTKRSHRRVHAARNHLFSALLKFARDLDFAWYNLPPSPRRVKYTPRDATSAFSKSRQNSPQIYIPAIISKYFSNTLQIVTWPF